jgi:protein-tyrosine phosphatase
MPWPSHRSLDGGIDRIPLPDSPGELWLCGKHVTGPDAETAMARVGATTIVCLNERHEIDERYPEYVEWLDAHRHDRAIWFPVPDLHAAPLAEFTPLVDELCRRLDAGEGLLIHCGAGMGRAGTVAVCILMAMGVAPDDALARVATHRPLAGPEVGAQRELIDEYAAHLDAANRPPGLLRCDEQ